MKNFNILTLIVFCFSFNFCFSQITSRTELRAQSQIICQTTTSIKLESLVIDSSYQSSKWTTANGYLAQISPDGLASNFEIGENKFVYLFNDENTPDDGFTDTITITAEEEASTPQVYDLEGNIQSNDFEIFNCSQNVILKSSEEENGSWQLAPNNFRGLIYDHVSNKEIKTENSPNEKNIYQWVTTPIVCPSKAINVTIHVLPDPSPLDIFILEAGAPISSQIKLSNKDTFCLNTNHYIIGSTLFNNEIGKWQVNGSVEVISDSTTDTYQDLFPTSTGFAEITLKTQNKQFLNCSSNSITKTIFILGIPTSPTISDSLLTLCISDTVTIKPQAEFAKGYIASPNKTNLLKIDKNSSPEFDIIPLISEKVLIEIFSINKCGINPQPESILIEIMDTISPSINLKLSDSICVGSNFNFNTEYSDLGDSTRFSWYVDEIDQNVNNSNFTLNNILKETNVKVEVFTDAKCSSVNHFSDEVTVAPIDPFSQSEIIGNFDTNCFNTPPIFTYDSKENNIIDWFLLSLDDSTYIGTGNSIILSENLTNEESIELGIIETIPSHFGCLTNTKIVKKQLLYPNCNIDNIQSSSQEYIKVTNPFETEIIVDSKILIKKNRLFDIKGNLIIETNSNQLDTYNLSKGFYFLETNTEIGVFKKVICKI